MSQLLYTVLIVDDCPEDCELYRRCLLQAKTHTYTFLEAESGQAGLALWQQHQPDIILLDYRLPDLDGLEWLAQLAAQTSSPRLPVIMVTGQGSEAIAVQAIKAGAQDYLVKGQITPEQLHRTVQQTLATVQLQTQLQHEISLRKLAESEYHQVQTQLQQGERVYQAVVENSPDIIVRFDLQFRHLYVSPILERITGVPAAHFLGKTCRELGLPDGMVNAWETAAQTLLETQQTQTIEFETPTPTGPRCFEMRIAPERAADGTMTSILCISRDITERKQSERQLHEMSDALSNAVEGISRLDPQGHYLNVNDAYAHAVGYTSEEMIGMNWERTVHPDDLEALTAAYQRMLTSGKVELEARGIRKDGSIFHKQLVMVSAYNDQHQFIGHHCFMKDITERKQLEAQFLRAQRLESIGTLASGIAHDLNNILTPVLAVAQLLPRKLAPVDPASQQLLELLEGSAKRGRDLVQQVLSFARGQDEQRHILQVGYLLSEMGKIARQTFPKSIQVQTQISTRDLWLMRADTTQLHQVLMNLCVNARDAMPDGGTLTIAAENCAIDETFARMHLDAQVGAYVKITITDTGTGIAPAVYDRIFDPFFTTKAQTHGTGLGLSTVRTIIKNHGGFLTIDTALRKGTSFQVYLPALLPNEDTTRNASPEAALPEPLNGNGELVLVVDDEAAIQQTIQVVLEAQGFQVLVAHDGIEAIALYAQHQSEIDLVLLDVMMPTMDGFKLIETLSKFMPPVPMIAMSGVASHQDRVLSHAQVQAFVAKPFTADALLAAIRSTRLSNPVKTPADQTRI